MAKDATTFHLLRNKQGFTLVELLIVVIILAVLAAIIVPQFGSSTEDANVSNLKTNLVSLRTATEIYYQQHNARYPGKFSELDGTTATTAAGCKVAFVSQLTQYTDKNGKVSGTKDATYKFGPYIKESTLPANPFLAGATAKDILCDILTNNITTAATADGTTGWKFYVLTGRLVANDNQTLSDGTTTTLSF